MNVENHEVNAENIQYAYNLVVKGVREIRATKREHDELERACEIIKTALISYLNITQMQTEVHQDENIETTTQGNE